MALEDVIRMADVIPRALEAGVTRFVLEDFGEEGEPPVWHWCLHSEDPVRWFIVTWGIHRGCERAGCQGFHSDSIEEDLIFALRAYVCEFDAVTVAHAPHRPISSAGLTRGRAGLSMH